MQKNTNPVPHLITATNEPMYKLEETILAAQAKIEAWLRQQWRNTPAPFYSSVDLRNAGFKLAPIDTNIFPAGFNNLNPDFLPLAIQAVQATLEQARAGCTNLILIPENHTRNTFYFESIAVLQDIFTKAGYLVRIGSLREDLTKPETINLPSGKKLLIERLEREADRLKIGDFYACVIILNNDLSAGLPEILQNLKPAILPPAELGWMRRLKSQHFHHYDQVAKEFAELIGVDEWFINPYFSVCDNVNFLKREGEAELAEKVQAMLAKIQKKYDEYNITHTPYVVIKADAGTYGMGVITVQSVEELLQLNRKKRTNMSTAKGDRPITQVILQEGVYTFETWNDAVAEPVVYMIGQYVIGGFYRIHNARGITENLNAPGMEFKPLAFAEPCNKPEHSVGPDECQNRFYVYGVIARLAAIAGAREQAQVKTGN